METYKMVCKYKEKRILVVNDEDLWATSVKMLLKKSRVNPLHQVDFVISDQQALDAIANFSSLGLHYRLIIIDFEIEGLDSLDLTVKLCALYDQL